MTDFKCEIGDGSTTLCRHEGCTKNATAKGLCTTHFWEGRDNGTLFYMKQRGYYPPCRVEGCTNKSRHSGYCPLHWQRKYRLGQTELLPVGDGRSEHPMYHFWNDRKAVGVQPEWLDFWTFVKDVGPRPTEKHWMYRLRNNEVWGPDNFRWVMTLDRREGETDQEWWARKWQNSNRLNPNRERGRHYKRLYGITVDQFDAMVLAQDNRCAICNDRETAIDRWSNERKSLSVDHDHSTGQVRDLLCWRCNSALGRAEDSAALLRKMADYLDKHSKLAAKGSPACAVDGEVGELVVRGGSPTSLAGDLIQGWLM